MCRCWSARLVERKSGEISDRLRRKLRVFTPTKSLSGSMAAESPSVATGSGVTAKYVCAVIPTDVTHWKELESDLASLGCLGLSHRPWAIRSDQLLREILDGVPNQFILTVRGRPDVWTEDLWAKVYGFKQSGLGLAARTDKFAVGKFRNPAHSKEGFSISDCISERHQRLLGFLIPILYPDKPSRVTITMANTIFGCFEGRSVNWAQVITQVVGKLASGLIKARTSPLSPYLFHLYHSQELLFSEEKNVYKTGLEIMSYGLTSEIEGDDDDTEGEEGEETPEVPVPPPKKETKRKITDPASRGKPPSPPVLDPPQEPAHEGAGDHEFFQAGTAWMVNARRMHFHMADIIASVTAELRVGPDDIIREIRKRTDPNVLLAKENRIRWLEDQLSKLQERNRALEAEGEVSKKRETDALHLVHSLKNLVEPPEHQVIRSQLFSEKLIQDGHVTGSTVLRILVDYEARMKEVLVEMRALLGYLDPEKPMDFSKFPDIFTGTPVKDADLLGEIGRGPESQAALGLKTLLHQTRATPSQQFSGKSSLRLGRGKELPKLPIRRDLLPDMGMKNPAKSYPEQFEHMQTDDVVPQKETIDLGEDEEPEGKGISKSESEEFESSEETEEEDETPPTRKFLPREAKKATPIKKPMTSVSSKVGTSVKKPRKGK